MAKSDTQTVDANADQTVPTDATATDVPADGTPAEAEAPKKAKTSIMVGTNVPLQMKELLDKLAEQNGETTAVWLRRHLATVVSYELPVAVRKGRATNKYVGMTDEEKKAAIATEQKGQRQKAAALLAALEAGDLDVDLAAILAKYKPAERAPRVTAPANAEATPAEVPAEQVSA